MSPDIVVRGFWLLLIVWGLLIVAVVALLAMRDWLRGNRPVIPPPADYRWLLRNGPRDRDLCRRRRVHEIV